MGRSLHRVVVCGNVVHFDGCLWPVLVAWCRATRHRGVLQRKLDFGTDRCALSVVMQCVSAAACSQCLLGCGCGHANGAWGLH